MISLPGISVLILSLINNYLIFVGIQMFYFNKDANGYPKSVQDLIMLNIIIAGLFLATVIWTISWFLIIKIGSILLSALTPKFYIWLQKRLYLRSN